MQACFVVLNMVPPSDAQLRRMFGATMVDKFGEMDDVVRSLAEPLTVAAVDIYCAVTAGLLPTPTKAHYLFNTRDLTRIVQGLLRASRAFYDSQAGSPDPVLTEFQLISKSRNLLMMQEDPGFFHIVALNVGPFCKASASCLGFAATALGARDRACSWRPHG